MSGTISTRWFWSDWMSDAGLRACGYAARGLWKDLLCIAGANKKEYGFVSLNGRKLDAHQIAQMTNGTEQEVLPLLDELERNGVFSRDRRGTIYCRRMVRAEKNRRNGRLGGNPNLLKEKENPKPVKPRSKPLIPEPEPKPEKESKIDRVPETRELPFVEPNGLAPSRAKNTGTRLPDGWTPSPSEIEYGVQLGLSRESIAEFAEDMRIWAGANANRGIARKDDWVKTFQGWLRREAKRAGGGANGKDRQGGGQGGGTLRPGMLAATLRTRSRG